MSSDIDRAWAAIAGHLDPAGPAPAAELDRLAARLGRPLPAQLRASLARHAGCADWPGGELLDPDGIGAEWEIWTGLAAEGVFADRAPAADAGAGGAWWDPRWIPVAADGGGNSLCVDAATGRLLDMDHEVGPRLLPYPDWAGYLADVADRLAGGHGAGAAGRTRAAGGSVPW